MSLLASCKVPESKAWVVSTLAGSDIAGFADDIGTAARFDYPTGVAVDSSGNVYVADSYNHRIRKITPAGVASTLAGSTSCYRNGAANTAKFDYPTGVAVDSYGNVYVADENNHRIRKITPADRIEDRVVSTLAGITRGFADGTGNTAQFNRPYGVAVDSSGTVYVADANNHRIRKITSAGMVNTLAGSRRGFEDGAGTEARFDAPVGVAVDSSGTVYVADSGNNRIRKITPADRIEDRVVSTLAGSTEGFADGTGTTAQFNYPFGVAVDSSGTVYVADAINNRIRKITPAGVVSTLAGSTEGHVDGTGDAAQFYLPFGVAVDSSGTVYVADQRNHRIRKITPADRIEDRMVSTFAGTGTAGSVDGYSTAQFYLPFGVAVDSSGNVHVADRENNRIRKIEYKVP